jgi:uncharacterized protein YjdB
LYLFPPLGNNHPICVGAHQINEFAGSALMKNNLYLALLVVFCFPFLSVAKYTNAGTATNAYHRLPDCSNKNSLGRDAESLLKERAVDVTQPLYFIENKGQVTDQHRKVRSDIQYRLAVAGGLNIFIGNGAIHYQFAREASSRSLSKDRKAGLSAGIDAEVPKDASYIMYRMDVSLMGADKRAAVVAEQQQGYYENYFTAGTSEGGITAHAYSKITYKDIFPHIDWVLYTSGGQLKHEFVIRKGGKISDIKIRYRGATRLQLDAGGNLIATTPQGTITEQAPYTYQADGKCIASGFTLSGNVLTYTTGNYEGDLVIDPGIGWATYYGGAGSEMGLHVAAGDSGNMYMTGYTVSTAGIATTGAYQTSWSGSNDGFLAKINSAGARQWATYYGGTKIDYVFSVAAGSGNVYIAGGTASTSGIATSGAYQTTYGGGSLDAYLVKFSSGGALIWATYYGGNTKDYANSIATDAWGNVYMAGYTEDTSHLATSGAYQTTSGGGTDAFLVKFNSAGVRKWATYFGGSAGEFAQSAVTDSMGNVYMTGITLSASGIASAGAYQTTNGGGIDAFLAKFDSTGVRKWATYFGGSSDDKGWSLATSGIAGVYLAGRTISSSGVASAGAFDVTYNGGTDAFLALFDSSGSRAWSTYYGGSGTDYGYAVSSDRWGNAYLGGSTRSSSGIATADGYKASFGGAIDAFCVKFNNAGQRKWATYYGGSLDDDAESAAIDALGNVYFCGGTSSTSGIATAGGYQTAFGGGGDGYLAKLNNNINDNSLVCIGSTINLDDSTAGGVWSSSNSSVATVGSVNGIVTAVAVGTASMTYALASGCMSTVKITVVGWPSAISGTTSVCPGTATSLSDAGGGTWCSGNTTIAVINSITGVLTGIAAGTATVTYSLGAGCIATTTATVNALPAPIAGVVSVCKGSTTTLSDAASGGYWSSTNTSVASIGSTSGIVNGLAVGSSTITYTLATGCSTSKKVTVNALPSAISGYDSVCKGATITLSDLTAGGTWSSSNTTVATIGAGTAKVTGVTAGSVTITYKSSAGCLASRTLTVDPLPSAITGNSGICNGSTVTLSDASGGGYWSSANTAVAVIGSGTGTVTAASAGTASVSYTLGTGCKVTKTVTVYALPAAIAGKDSVCTGFTRILSDATGGGKWSSSNTTLATVGSASGIVTAKMTAGSLTITYTLSTGCMATKALTVNSCNHAEPEFNDSLLAANILPNTTAILQVYPNPNDGSFCLLLSSATDEQAIMVITNIIGQKILEFPVNANKAIPVMMNAAPGLYVISVATATGRYVEKVAIRK